MKGKVTEVLVEESTIKEKVRDLAVQLNHDYADKEVIAVCLLKGSIIFLSDLIRHLNFPITIEVMRASSYGEGTKSSGSVKIITDLETDIKNKHVLVVEDIVDTGRTLSKTMKLLAFRSPKSLKICTFLNKPSRREIPINIDYVGMVIEDHFVVGYGLDYAEYYRNLAYIGILELEDS